MNIVTLCDSFSDLKSGGYDRPVDLVLCLGDLSNLVLAERVACISPRYGAYGIRGNHDDINPFPECVRDINFKIEEVNVGSRVVLLSGIPGSWRYKSFGHWLYYQDEIADCIDGMPRADIVLSHNCPAGIGHERRGESFKEDRNGVHQGFSALNEYIAEQHPAFLFHGHQHIHKMSRVNQTTVVGCYGEDQFEITLP